MSARPGLRRATDVLPHAGNVRRVPSIIPTRRTRAVVELMLSDTDGTAYDTALRHLRVVDPGQYPAVVGLLLANARRPRNANLGRRPMPYLYTPEERRQGKAAWKRGERTADTEARRREYDRWAAANARRRRGQASRDDDGGNQ